MGTSWTDQTDQIPPPDTASIHIEAPAQRPFLPALSLKLFFGGLDSHDEHMRANIDQTLHRIKAIAEA